MNLQYYLNNLLNRFIQLLEYLYIKENFKVNTDELIKLGFHAWASYLPSSFRFSEA